MHLMCFKVSVHFYYYCLLIRWGCFLMPMKCMVLCFISAPHGVKLAMSNGCYEYYKGIQKVLNVYSKYLIVMRNPCLKITILILNHHGI